MWCSPQIKRARTECCGDGDSPVQTRGHVAQEWLQRMLVVMGHPAVECVNQPERTAPFVQPLAFLLTGAHELVGVDVPLRIVIADASQGYKVPFIQEMTRSRIDRQP